MMRTEPDDNLGVRPPVFLRQAVKILIFALAVFPLSGQGYTLSRRDELPLPFPDNAPVRVLKYDEIVSAISEVRYSRDDFLNLHPGPGRVRFSVETQEGFLYLLFTNERDGEFPLYSAGSYIIKRSLENGRFIQIKVFYKSDPGSFVRLFPNGDRTAMDVYLLGESVSSGVNLPMPFETYLKASFEEVIRTSRSAADWEMLLPPADGRPYRALLNMREVIRNTLQDLPDAEDGALDADGRWVSIETEAAIEPGGLNCSGFAKWVVDGIYGPLAGEYLEIAALKKRLTDIRGNRWSDRREYERDPYFGLDWTRNLAGTLGEALYGRPVSPESADVTAGRLRVYREDIGYAVEDLPLVLYEQSVRQPGHFYLGSVNGIFGEDPPLRQHYHVALFFPVLTSEGNLDVAVFERGEETPFEAFVKRYPGEFVHLVQIRAAQSFSPPPVPLP